ncbi:DUF1788 domain-containing protein, partial [bacterium]|nr:DUF1788 domain-containing protein [bacterium]
MEQRIDSKSPINDRFNHLLKLISSKKFLLKEGLGNEIPFFICDYDPKETIEITRMIQNLSKTLDSQNVRVLQIDLYDLVIEI